MASVKFGTLDLGEFPLLLAPMEDVSDPPFRAVCKMHGADLMYTEFISSEGLIRNAAKSKQKLDIFEYERPVGIQLYGSNIESMVEAARIADAVHPELIDINYGCPVKGVACKGAGAGLLQDVPRMVAMTAAIVKVASRPVTVKTRLGWDDSSKNIVEVAQRLQDVGIAALTIHGRTRAQLYKGPADWTLIGEVKNHPSIFIPIIGNGDVDSPEKALEMKNRYGVDGLMIGRASIGHPWIFNEIKHFLNTGTLAPPPDVVNRVATCRRHLELSLQWKGPVTGIHEMRRHYASYFKGFDHFKEYRMRLVTTYDANEIYGIMDEILEKYPTPVVQAE